LPVTLEGFGRRCVSYFTLRTSVILMETIKDLYKRLLDHHAASLTVMGDRFQKAKQSRIPAPPTR
jgi:hypothetical protein